jgi:hypothetical protein
VRASIGVSQSARLYRALELRQPTGQGDLPPRLIRFGRHQPVHD